MQKIIEYGYILMKNLTDFKPNMIYIIFIEFEMFTVQENTIQCKNVTDIYLCDLFMFNTFTAKHKCHA